jgi:peptidoglycan hydrolase CwlO-like protein
LKQEKLENVHENKQLQNQLEQASSEIELLKQQARMYFDQGESLSQQMNQLREKITQQEHQLFNQSSSQDMQVREIQMLKNQLN